MSAEQIPPTTSPETAAPVWRSSWRWLVSALVLAHLGAVAVAPLNFASRAAPGQESPLARSLLGVARPYVQAAYLDHGYFYFAPNPGASHLVRYEILDEQGRGGEERTFPSLQEQWPRLIYHRHFMLSEWLSAHHTPPEPPRDLARDPDLREAQLQAWKDRREMYQAVWQSFERHLESKHGHPVRMKRVEHRPPRPEEALSGMPLSHPSLYRDLSETTPAPPGPPPSPGMPPGPLRPPQGPLRSPFGPPLQPEVIQ